ncbi:unnamed protein product [Arabis nemorensis]|uniref:Pentacotripeptide-repeat region of PRORP domain-containing protein n=1 Tax=Arabis nemorensis TaxID=586526 RepID=A0A565AVP0_9BRAS|nr:unnamed protein product [Arabis nemorensis]
MSLLRRIRWNPQNYLCSPRRQLTSSASAVPYPLGRRDPYSLPLSLTQKPHPEEIHFIDSRPISLRYRVAAVLELSALDDAATISRFAVFDRFRTDAIVPCNAVIDAMCRAKRYEDAIALFHFFFNKSGIAPNTLSFNLIIKAHCDEGHVDDALHLYRHFTAFFAPDSDTHRLLAQGLVDAGRIEEAVSLTTSVVDWKVHNVLIRGFLDLRNHDRAHELFSQVKAACDADGIAFVSCTFLDYWCERGEDEDAYLDNWCERGEDEDAYLDKAMSYLPSKVELVSGNKLVEVLFKHGRTSTGWAYFRGMLKENIFDSQTINIAVNEYFKHGEFGEALETLKRSPPEIMSGSLSNIIARLCERGMVSEAESLLEEMTSPGVATFRALIDAYVRAGRVDDALRIFNKMMAARLRNLAIDHAH